MNRCILVVEVKNVVEEVKNVVEEVVVNYNSKAKVVEASK